jgi:hypothetical protein
MTHHGSLAGSGRPTSRAGGQRQVHPKTWFVPGLLLALALTACGRADGGGGVATANGTASASAVPVGGRGDALKFAQCMRDNGLPDFKDPGASGGGGALLPQGADPKQVQAAQEKCKQYLPNGGEPPKVSAEEVERSRQFAKCMRANGVPDFPDPAGDSGAMGGRQLEGVDTKSPEFKAGVQKCEKLVPRPTGGPGGPGGGAAPERGRVG